MATFIAGALTAAAITAAVSKLVKDRKEGRHSCGCCGCCGHCGIGQCASRAESAVTGQEAEISGDIPCN